MIPKHLRQKQHHLYKIFMEEKLVGMHDERKEVRETKRLQLVCMLKPGEETFFISWPCFDRTVGIISLPQQ